MIRDFGFLRNMARPVFTGLGLLCLLGDVSAQEWFSEGAVQCSVSSTNINFGAYGNISDVPPSITGNFPISCKSRAYPSGYASNYRTVSGGYCLYVVGEQKDRVLEGQGRNADVSIPFNFYNNVRFNDPNMHSNDYTRPIGNGTWGMGFWSVGYRDGDPNRPQPPVEWGAYYPLFIDSGFIAKITRTGGQVYPAGTYSNSFSFAFKVGQVKIQPKFPSDQGIPHVCGYWQPYGYHYSQITVSIEIKKYCNIAVQNHINFGKQPYLAKDITAKGQIAVNCTPNVGFGVGINQGSNSADGKQRAMKLRGSENDIILYNLYQDSAMTLPWGEDWGGNTILKGVGTGQDKLYDVYAQVPKQSVETAGLYSDTLIVTVRVMDDGT